MRPWLPAGAASGCRGVQWTSSAGDAVARRRRGERAEAEKIVPDTYRWMRRNVRLRRSTPPAVPATSAQTRSLARAISDERQPEHRELAARRPVRVDELRQEGQEEQRGLRVEHVHDDARRYVRPSVGSTRPAADSRRRGSGASGSRARRGTPRRASFTHGERLGGGGEERGEADHGRDDVDEPAGRDAERRDDARRLPPGTLCATM